MNNILRSKLSSIAAFDIKEGGEMREGRGGGIRHTSEEINSKRTREEKAN